MTYNVDANVIIQALRDGASQEDIAKAFAEALNQASSTLKKEEAARKIEIENKKAGAQAAADFLNAYYPGIFGHEIVADALIEACDTILNFDKQLTNLLSSPAVENPFFRFFN